MLLIPVQSLVFVIPFVITVFARGYNEGDYIGVENYTTSRGMRFSYNNTLQLDGIAFGNNPAQTFATWASQATCNISVPALYGITCVDSAIKSASYAAAEGVYGSNTDVENTIALSGTNTQQGAYSIGDIGQGSSCNHPTTFATQPATCPNSGLNSIPLASGKYYFPTRGIKVTCKAACGQSASLDQSNWNGIIGQVTAFLRDNNYYAARFTISIPVTNTALVRCRVTSPNISQFGIDICPDRIPTSGPQAFIGDN